MADRKLVWLEVMRGLAALWVLLHHATQSVNHFVAPLGDKALLIENGYLGVDFFFVLSGFIIAHSCLRLDSPQGGGVKAYFKARLVRIYVPYLPVGVGIYLLYLMLPGLSQAERTPSLLSTLFLLPSDAPPALSVAWTLIHEMIFYLIVSLWFVSRRAFWSVVTLWVAAILWVQFSALTMSRFTNYFLSPVNLCFVLGLGISSLNQKITVSKMVTACLATGGALVVCAQALNQSPDRLWVTVGFGMLVLAAANSRTKGVEIWPLALSIGTASYAIYLVHNPVLSLAVRLTKAMMPTLGAWSSLLLISLIALGAGWLYWWVYEQRALRAVRAWLTPRSAKCSIN